MMMLTSLAALTLGAVPVQAQSSVQPQIGSDEVKAEVSTATASVASPKPVWTAKPKPWPAADAAEPAAKLSVAKI